MSSFSSVVSHNSSDFQRISGVINDVVLDIRYYSSNNFTGKKIKRYNAPVPCLTKKALNAFAEVAADLKK